VHFHSHRESGFSRPFEHGFLAATTASLIVAKGDGFNATNEVAQGWIFNEVGEGIAVRCRHQGHPPFSNRAGCTRFQLSADFINDDHLWHVVFHGLNHHLVLKLWPSHLHAPRSTNGGMGNVTIPRNFIARVNHHNTLPQVIGKNASDLA
jgi:hypothetical protein